MLGCWLYSVETLYRKQCRQKVKMTGEGMCVVRWWRVHDVILGAQMTPKMMSDDDSPK